MKKLGEEFYEHVNAVEVASELDIDLDTVDCVYNYWLLKRKVALLYIRQLLVRSTWISALEVDDDNCTMCMLKHCLEWGK